ncbi:hypothetical protein BH20ACT18_BH20ACT18_08530 [soil metagenome]
MAAEEPARAAPEDPEALVAREARDRSRAVAAAALAAALPLLATVATLIINQDAPKAGENREAESLIFGHEHATELILVIVAVALGYVAVGIALQFLYRATKGRRPELPSAARWLTVGGSIALGLSLLVIQVVLTVKASDFVALPSRTDQAAKDLLDAPAFQAAAYLRLLAPFALGFGFVLIALNAMRAGLLTRFMGVLGIIVGALFVIPLGSPLPIIQSLWFGALALLFSGRWPNGMPPAWASGEAVPWPSQQEIREQRERDRAAAEPEPEPDPDPYPAVVTAGEKAHPASKKRKRKRRR